MGKKLILPLFVVALGLAATFWLYQPEEPAPEPVVVAPPPPPVAPPPALPVEQHPIPAEAANESPALPDLEHSDAPYRQALTALFGEKTLNKLFHPERMIRRFVATIDNLPRRHAPVAMMPVKPVAGSFRVVGQGDTLSIASANAERYAGYLKVMLAVEPRRLVDTYVSFYPLFQKAYRELGYPDGFFNDRLVAAIDDLLATPETAPPIALIQPKVLYAYADPSLEARSAGQRIMLRFGGANQAQAQQALRAIRQELLSRSPTASTQ